MTLHYHLGLYGFRPIGWRRRSSLLSNLFRLDGTPTILAAGVMPSMSPGDTVANTVFPPGAWIPPTRRIKNVTFRNVAFSKTTISPVTRSEEHQSEIQSLLRTSYAVLCLTQHKIKCNLTHI